MWPHPGSPGKVLQSTDIKELRASWVCNGCRPPSLQCMDEGLRGSAAELQQCDFVERKLRAPERRKCGRKRRGRHQQFRKRHRKQSKHAQIYRYQTMCLYLQCQVEGKRLIGFRQVIVFHSDEDGLVGLRGQQEGCSINGFKVPRVDSLQLRKTSKRSIVPLVVLTELKLLCALSFFLCLNHFFAFNGHF